MTLDISKSVDIIETSKEIAEQLDYGFRAFMHKTTGQVLFVPDFIHHPGVETETWNEELEQLETHSTDYREIDKWTSKEAFEMMIDFTDQLTDHML